MFQLLEDPPDNSTVLGYHVIYIAVDEEEILECSGLEVLVVENLPTFEEVEKALTVYLERTMQIDVVSCNVEGGKAYIQFNHFESNENNNHLL